MGRLARGEMTPAQRLRLQRREKEAAYLRSIGRPVSIDPGPVIEHVQALSRRGMTGSQMAAQSNVSKSTILDYVRGTRTSDRGGTALKYIDRGQAEALLAVRYEPPTDLGAAVDGTGVRRMLQGLSYLGFSGPFLAGDLGVSSKRVNEMTTRVSPVRYATVQRVEQLYGKLSEARPEDHGLGSQGISRSRGAALRNGYAPPSCWDPDTIHDPKAIPEWTGACGTAEGLRIHQRDGIPACPPCLAVNLGPAQGKVRLDPKKLKAARNRRGISMVALGDLLGVSDSTINYWEMGRSAPRSRNLVDQLLAALDIDLEDAV